MDNTSNVKREFYTYTKLRMVTNIKITAKCIYFTEKELFLCNKGNKSNVMHNSIKNQLSLLKLI